MESCLMVPEFRFGKTIRVQKMDDGDDCITTRMYLILLNGTLKMINTANFVMCISLQF